MMKIRIITCHILTGAGIVQDHPEQNTSIQSPGLLPVQYLNT